MAPKQPCAKYQYVVTPAGPKILPVDEPSCKDEESPADYNAGGYLPVKVGDTFKHGRYRVIRKLGCVSYILSLLLWLIACNHCIIQMGPFLHCMARKGYTVSFASHPGIPTVT